MLNYGSEDERGLTPLWWETLERGRCQLCLFLVSTDCSGRVQLRCQFKRLQMARWGQTSAWLVALIFFGGERLFPQAFLSKVRLANRYWVGTDRNIQSRLQELLFQKRPRNRRSNRLISLSGDTAQTLWVFWGVSSLLSHRKFHVWERTVAVWLCLQRNSQGRRPVWEEYYALLTP